MSALMSALSTSSYAATYQPYQLQAPTQQPQPVTSAKSITHNPTPAAKATAHANNADRSNGLHSQGNTDDNTSEGGAKLGSLIDTMA